MGLWFGGELVSTFRGETKVDLELVCLAAVFRDWVVLDLRVADRSSGVGSGVLAADVRGLTVLARGECESTLLVGGAGRSFMGVLFCSCGDFATEASGKLSMSTTLPWGC